MRNFKKFLSFYIPVSKNMLYTVYILLLSVQIVATCEKNVVFDLGGVLFEHRSSASLLLRHIGLSSLLSYGMAEGIKIKHLKKTVLAILHKIKPRENLIDVSIPLDANGQPLPLLMQEWLEGNQSSAEILATIEKAVIDSPSLYSSAIEKIIFLKIVQLIFDPSLFVQTQVLHADAIDLVHKLKKDGFKVYILSNWDKESFALLQGKYPSFFNLFDGITISGNHGNSKPSTSFYHTFLNSHQLNATDCIFIDDQKVNVHCASNAGMNAFICPHKKTLLLKKKKPNLRMAYHLIVKKSQESS